jgi:O-antigen/teichoic acid export membrane protein
LKRLYQSIFKRDRALNLFFRALTIVSKFLLSLIIVKSIGVSELGVYGIFQTTVMLLVYLLGFDFYTFNAREITREERRPITFYLGNQLLFHAIIYVFVLPLSLLIFWSRVLPPEYGILFYLVLITEHLSQEVYRVLIVLKKSVVASFTLFLRSGLWVGVLYFIWTFGLGGKTLTLVFWFWFTGALVSILIGALNFDLSKKFRVDWKWIKLGARISGPFLIATVFYKIIEYSGRYFLDFFWTKDEVGIFTFFSSVSNTMFVLVHSTVIIVMTPHLLSAANKNIEEFNRVFQKFRNQVLAASTAGFILAGIFIFPVLDLIDTAPLNSHISEYFFLLLATGFFCLSYIPHYRLYAYRQDRSLLQAAIVGATINIFANWVLVPNFGLMGAAFSQVLSMFFLLLIKVLLSRKYQKEVLS